MVIREVTEKQRERVYEQFLCLVGYWRLKNDYAPKWED
jgi:hypothetical protein